MMPRICITSPDFTGPVRNGGVGTACFYQACNLSDAGFSVEVIFTGNCEVETSAYWERYYRHNYDWDYLDLSKWAEVNLSDCDRISTYPASDSLRTSRLLLECLKNKELDVVYFQDYMGHALFPLHYKRVGLGFRDTAFCLTVHSFRQWILDGMRQFPSSLFDFINQQIEVETLRLAEALIAPSCYMADWTSKKICRNISDFEVLPYCYNSKSVPSNLSCSEVFGPFDHLVFFGRLETRKGLHLFLDAIAASPAIRSRLKRVTFLGRHATVLGIPSSQKITVDMERFPGLRWEIIDNLNTHQALDWLRDQTHTLVVAPSQSDNLPLSIIELFSSRLPFITSNVGGIPEIIGPANVHLTTTPDVASLRHAIEEILHNGELEIHYKGGYDPDIATHMHVEHVHRLIRNNNRRQPLPENNVGPVVSVIVPHFNSIAYLKVSLITLLEQSFDEPYEVIVVDDASDAKGAWDALRRLIEELDDDRIRLIRTPMNTGPGASRNCGLREAHGRYLVFFDADNEAMPHMLSTMVTAIRNSGLDCLTCFNRVIRQNDRNDPKPLDPAKASVIYTPLGASLELGAFINVYGDTTSIMRRTVPDAVGGWPEERDCREDWEFFTKVCVHGLGFGVIPEILCLYRDSSSSRRNQRTNSNNYVGQVRIMRHLASAHGNMRMNLHDILLLTSGLLFPAMSTNAGNSGSDLLSIYNCFAKLNSESMIDYLRLGLGDFKQSDSEQAKTIRRVREVLGRKVNLWEKEESNKRVLLFGAGSHSKVLLGVMPSLSKFLIGFIDSRIRGEFLGLPCYAPSKINAGDVDAVVYSSAVHEKEMYRSMQHLDIEHILLYHDDAIV